MGYGLCWRRHLAVKKGNTSGGMRIGLLHKLLAMYCDEPILYYWDLILKTFLKIAGDRHELLPLMDGATDRAELFLNLSPSQRQEFWQQLQEIDYSIPTLETFFKDRSYLESRGFRPPTRFDLVPRTRLPDPVACDFPEIGLEKDVEVEKRSGKPFSNTVEADRYALSAESLRQRLAIYSAPIDLDDFSREIVRPTLDADIRNIEIALRIEHAPGSAILVETFTALPTASIKGDLGYGLNQHYFSIAVLDGRLICPDECYTYYLRHPEATLHAQYYNGEHTITSELNSQAVMTGLPGQNDARTQMKKAKNWLNEIARRCVQTT
ncbi:hypothetical protein F1880_008373 [Penicillium rolfsii]|nr:hypothetical protein F1880_008373 [Penicillium rolfsii]